MLHLLYTFRGNARRSLADIVVATPGRLVDHINKNPGFCLEHLRFLVSLITCNYKLLYNLQLLVITSKRKQSY